MDYDEFDTTTPQDIDYPDADEEEFHVPERRPRATASLSLQQIAFILGVNAIISLIISLVVVILAGRNLSSQPATALLPGTVVTNTEPPPGVEAPGPTSQTQPSASDTPLAPADATISAAQPVSKEESSEETPVEPTIYVVQAGDTLGTIADKFDVSLEDLMRANGLANPDYVQGGQELIIPIGGLPPATPTFTPVPVPTDTPLPFNPPTPLPAGTAPPAEPAATTGPTPTPVPTLASASGSEIRVVLQVLNPGNLVSEAVQIVNQGPFLRLTGWTLSDEAGNTYTFPDFSLWGGGAINIHTAGGSNTTTDLYWGQSQAMWKVGGMVTLRDAGGTVIATFVVPEP